MATGFDEQDGQYQAMTDETEKEASIKREANKGTIKYRMRRINPSSKKEKGIQSHVSCSAH
jgi:hypothetical protein